MPFSGWYSTDSIDISIQNAPDASIITTDLSICEGESLQLQAANPEVFQGPHTHPFNGISSTIAAGNYTIS